MKNVIYATEKRIERWTRKYCDTFFNEFSAPIEAERIALRFIQKAYDKKPNTYEALPKIICDAVQYVIGAFWEKGRFCIAIMNPRNGDFGKAILNPPDKLNIYYGIALACARMKKDTEYQVMKHTNANKIELRNGQLIYNSKHIPSVFIGYCPTNKEFGVVVSPEGKYGAVKLENFYID